MQPRTQYVHLEWPVLQPACLESGLADNFKPWACMSSALLMPSKDTPPLGIEEEVDKREHWSRKQAELSNDINPLGIGMQGQKYPRVRNGTNRVVTWQSLSARCVL